MTRAHAWLLLGAVLHAMPAAAQDPEPASSDSVAQFLDAARRAAEKYRDRAVAVREGFRRVGPDFPGMGEHWIQPGRLVSARFRVEAPVVLTYAVIGGEPSLTGVAYALPLSASESPPEFPAPGSWHDHAASVDEESLLIAPLAHAHGHAVPGDAARARLSMLHVWLWSPNPDGIFAQENWALPYHRLGLAVPAVVDPNAARALSFLSGGTEYYQALLRAAAALDGVEKHAVSRTTARFREELERWVAAQPASWSASEHATDALRDRWAGFWAELEGVVRAETWDRLAKFAPETARD